MSDFKVGDTVRCVDAYRTDGALKACEEYIVKNVRSTFLDLEGPTHGRTGWKMSRFVLVSRAEGDFKVGDRVRCVDAYKTGGKLKSCEEYIVKSVRPPYVDLEGPKFLMTGWGRDRFVLVSRAEDNIKPEDEIKVGDVVRRVGDTTYCTDISVGGLYIVSSIRESRLSLELEGKSGAYTLKRFEKVGSGYSHNDFPDSCPESRGWIKELTQLRTNQPYNKGDLELLTRHSALINKIWNVYPDYEAVGWAK